MNEIESYIRPQALRMLRQFPELFGPGPWSIRKISVGWGFTCGDGWFPILEDLCADLAKIVRQDQLTQFRVSQVMGMPDGLRVKVRGGTDRIAARIGEAERASAATCERCGRSPAEMRNIGGLRMTCCPACRADVAREFRL